MKKLAALLLAAVCITGTANIKAEEITDEVWDVKAAANVVLIVGSKTAIIDGQEVSMIAEPVVKDNRTYLPLRFLTEKVLDAEVNWDNTLKKATVKNNGLVVEVSLNNKTAVVNGNKVEIDAPPGVVNNSIVLPVRFMSETFGMVVHYNSNDKSIRIFKSAENNAPVADFEFSQEYYTKGQKVEIRDKSYDPDKDQIVSTLWELNDKTYRSIQEVQNELNKATPGYYTVILQVKDCFGMWSEEARKTIEIRANMSPVVTQIIPDKTTYAQGEKISLTYKYENEEWEELTGERWTYRQANEPAHLAVTTRPEALFAKGDYIVTLQVTDAYGNTSQKAQTTIHVTDQVKDTEFNYKFNYGKPGDTIDNIKGTDYRRYKEVNVRNASTNSDTLVMSDSPEDVHENGILYTTDFNGKGRLLLHHISGFTSGTDRSKMLIVAAENTYTQPVIITLTNKVIKGPAADVMFLGQQVVKDYFNTMATETITLLPGEKVYLYTSKEKAWLSGQCISGIMDIQTTGNIKLTTAVMDKTDSIDKLNELMVLDKSVHVRGTFEGTVKNYEVVPDTTESSMMIVGQYQDEWVSGTDMVTGESVKNKGNYGVTYKIQIRADQDMGIILNPRADIFRGAVKWEGESTFLAPTYGYFMNTNKKAVMLGTIKAGQTKTLEYMLPNGSSAPVLIGFIPASQWNK